MRRSEAKSHRVGRATLDTGEVTTAYRVVVACACVRCAGTIAPGALFSRQTRRTPTGALGVTTTDPVCVACRPLRLENTDETAATDAREI